MCAAVIIKWHPLQLSYSPDNSTLPQITVNIDKYLFSGVQILFLANNFEVSWRRNAQWRLSGYTPQ